YAASPATASGLALGIVSSCESSPWRSPLQLAVADRAAFAPQDQAALLKPRRNAATDGAHSLAVALPRSPITGIVGCCARAPSGHVAAAPPSSVMNARRLTRSPRRQAPVTCPGFRGRAP